MRRQLVAHGLALASALLMPIVGDAQSMHRADSASATGDRHATLGTARAWSRAGKPEAAAAILRTWVRTHADDADAWELLARDEMRAGRPRAAALAAGKADSLRGKGSSPLWRSARAQQAPAIDPSVTHQSDSDGNRVVRWGLIGSVAPAEGARLGAVVYQGQLSSAVESVELMQGRGQLLLRPRSDIHLRVEGGLDRFTGEMAGLWVTPTGEARFRWRAPLRGPALDLRVQHGALAASPLLVNNRVVRSEARGSLELPLGVLRLRGGGRVGGISARGEEANTRTGSDLSVVLPLGWQGEVSAQYHRLSYGSASAAGYFAPRLVETREGGMYVERESGGGVTLALDLGVGVQRMVEHVANSVENQPTIPDPGQPATPGQPVPPGGQQPNAPGAQQPATPGRWERALRGWSSLAIPFAPGRALWIEVEWYDAPFAPEGVTTSASWRFVSMSAGLRWALR